MVEATGLKSVAKRLAALAALILAIEGHAAAQTNEAGTKGRVGIRLSDSRAAERFDIAVGADEVIHAIYSETPSQKLQLYYRRSLDGGATWSVPENIGKADPDRVPGTMRLLVDGSSRLYAIWKAVKPSAGDTPLGWQRPGTLVYRVKDGEKWGPLQEISVPYVYLTNSGARGWFAGTDKSGAVRVVWLEDQPNIKYPVDQSDQGLVLSAILDPGKSSSPVPVMAASVVDGPFNSKKIEGYSGIHGYFDADGQARWTAVKANVRQSSQSTDIVYWKAGKEIVVDTFKESAGSFSVYPPRLLADGAGLDHVILLDYRQEPPELLDYAISPDGKVAEPVLIAAPPKATGKIVSFQVASGSPGQMGVLAQISEDGSAPEDLHVYVASAGKWIDNRNMTQNQKRRGFKSDTEHDLTSLSHCHAVSACGAFEKDDSVDVLTLERELTSATAGFTSASGSSDVIYFTRP